jgi:hypothetical protein
LWYNNLHSLKSLLAACLLRQIRFIWARTGFDQELKSGTARRGSLVGLVKTSGQTTNANDNSYAMTVAEADALLNSFEFEAAEALAA